MEHEKVQSEHTFVCKVHFDGRKRSNFTLNFKSIIPGRLVFIVFIPVIALASNCPPFYEVTQIPGFLCGTLFPPLCYWLLSGIHWLVPGICFLSVFFFVFVFPLSGRG